MVWYDIFPIEVFGSTQIPRVQVSHTCRVLRVSGSWCYTSFDGSPRNGTALDAHGLLEVMGWNQVCFPPGPWYKISWALLVGFSRWNYCSTNARLEEVSKTQEAYVQLSYGNFLRLLLQVGVNSIWVWLGVVHVFSNSLFSQEQSIFYCIARFIASTENNTNLYLMVSMNHQHGISFSVVSMKLWQSTSRSGRFWCPTEDVPSSKSMEVPSKAVTLVGCGGGSFPS